MQRMFVYIGTYTKQPQGHGEGIYVYRFQPDTGAMTHVQTVSGLVNPSFLAVSSDGRNLYAVTEREEAHVAAFARDPQTGKLRALNSEVAHGVGACYVSLDHSGKFVLAANYGSGSAAALPIGDDGHLSPASSWVQHEGSSVHPERQEGPHAHMIAPAPDGRFVLAVDLGADRIIAYRLDESSGKLEPAEDPAAGARAEPGAGPRHFSFTPDGRYVYVINELASTLTAYAYDSATGAMNQLATVPTLPSNFEGENTTAQVVVSPDGKFVYGSNRGHDSIACWSIGPDGALTFVGCVSSGGTEPRNFNIDPSGRWLLAANQHSNTVVTFRRNPATGLIEQTGTVVNVPTPVCVVFAGSA
jgi:6-phosphogluconolactonase